MFLTSDELTSVKTMALCDVSSSWLGFLLGQYVAKEGRGLAARFFLPKQWRENYREYNQNAREYDEFQFWR